MDDLISRRKAIELVSESMRQNHHKDGKEACAHEYEHRHFLKILYDLPSEKKKGHWETWLPETEKISIDGKLFSCSECDWKFSMPFNFCPQCGADMRESDD